MGKLASNSREDTRLLLVHVRVFSRDILKVGEGDIGVRAGGKGVLGVYYLLENIIHYYYCQSEGGKTAVKGGDL